MNDAGTARDQFTEISTLSSTGGTCATCGVANCATCGGANRACRRKNKCTAFDVRAVMERTKL